MQGQDEQIRIGLTDDTITALQESEERFRLALDATSDGVWDWNVKTGKVIFSDKWRQSLGYSPDDVPGDVSAWMDILHPDDRDKTMKTVNNHFAGKTTTYIIENRLKTKSGEYRHNLDRGRVFEWDDDGTPLRMIGTDTDITLRKVAETEREDAIKRLESALSEIKTLRGIILMCSYCKNIRGNKGAWENLETYIVEHSAAHISHGICPECLVVATKDAELDKK